MSAKPVDIARLTGIARREELERRSRAKREAYWATIDPFEWPKQQAGESWMEFCVRMDPHGEGQVAWDRVKAEHEEMVRERERTRDRNKKRRYAKVTQGEALVGPIVEGMVLRNESKAGRTESRRVGREALAVIKAMPEEIRQRIKLGLEDFATAELVQGELRVAVWAFLDQCATASSAALSGTAKRRGALAAWKALWGAVDVEVRGLPWNPVSVWGLLCAVRGCPPGTEQLLSSGKHTDMPRLGGRPIAAVRSALGIDAARWEQLQRWAALDDGTPRSRCCAWLMAEVQQCVEDNVVALYPQDLTYTDQAVDLKFRDKLHGILRPEENPSGGGVKVQVGVQVASGGNSVESFASRHRERMAALPAGDREEMTRLLNRNVLMLPAETED